MDIFRIAREIAHWWMPQDLPDDKSIFTWANVDQHLYH